MRPLPHLGRGPGTYPGEALQRPVRRRVCPGQSPFQGRGPTRGPDQGPAAALLDTRSQEPPARHLGPRLRRRRETHPVRRRVRVGRRTGCRLAELADQQPPGAEGLLAGDHLLDAGRSQCLEDRLGPPDPVVAPAAVRLEQRLVLRPDGEAGDVVGLADQPRQLVQRPVRTVAPRARRDLGAMPDDLDQGRTGRRPGGPQVDVAESSMGRVARTTAKVAEDGCEQHRPVEQQVPGQAAHRAGLSIMNRPSAVLAEPVAQQDFPRREVGRLDLGHHLVGAGRPGLLGDHPAGGGGQPAATPGRHHPVADLDHLRPVVGRRAVEPDVAHGVPIHDHLVDPPRRAGIERPLHHLIGSDDQTRAR